MVQGAALLLAAAYAGAHLATLPYVVFRWFGFVAQAGLGVGLAIGATLIAAVALTVCILAGAMAVLIPYLAHVRRYAGWGWGCIVLGLVYGCLAFLGGMPNSLGGAQSISLALEFVPAALTMPVAHLPHAVGAVQGCYVAGLLLGGGLTIAADPRDRGT